MIFGAELAPSKFSTTVFKEAMSGTWHGFEAGLIVSEFPARTSNEAVHNACQTTTVCKNREIRPAFGKGAGLFSQL